MKKFISFILAAISILSISVLFTGCGTQTVDDITGEYVKIKDGKEIKQDNKQYYLIVLQKNSTYQNKSAVQLRFTIQRHNPDLNKLYYVNRDFYIDPQTLQSFDTETNTITVKDDNQIILNGAQYKKVSSKTVAIDDTNYTAKKLIEELVKIPKFYEMDDTHISDPIRGFTTELRQYVNY